MISQCLVAMPNELGLPCGPSEIGRSYDADDIYKLIDNIETISCRPGFEFYPFKVGWYNDCVQNPFTLPYEYDTVAVLVVSVPSMFENYFLPFLSQTPISGIRDPIDECVSKHLIYITQNLKEKDIDIIHDYDMHPSRRPKILVQTACHVSGAAYFYQRSDILNDAWPKTKKIFGVCVHPKYGGWFAMRGVFIFRSILCTSLPRILPADVVCSDDDRIEVLQRFNFRGQEWAFREIIPTKEQYSSAQKIYFQTKPSDRQKLLQSPLFVDLIKSHTS